MATFLPAPALRVVVAATAAEDAAVTTREVTVVTAGERTAAITLEELEQILEEEDVGEGIFSEGDDEECR